MKGVNGQTLMRQIIQVCDLLHIWVERRNTGQASYTNAAGKQRAVRYGEKGTGDLSGILPHSGQYLEIEAKAHGELPTVHQGNRILEINRHGGFAFWTDDITTAETILREALAITHAGGTPRMSYTSITQAILHTSAHDYMNTPDPLIVWPAHSPAKHARIRQR
jgi:hypothetical protein